MESCRPYMVDTTDEALLLRCLNNYDVWCLRDDVSVTPSLKAHGYWEAWITSWFTRAIQEDDFVVDVGAHCGYFTMLFDRLVGNLGLVIAYEASPVYAALLEKTKEANNARFCIENLAVADKPGTLTLTYPGAYTGSASVVCGFDEKWGEPTSVEVEATTLDYELADMTTPEFIKIDAESAEEIIWNGAKEVLSRDDAPVVVLEYSPTGVYSKDFDQALFDYGHVRRIGYDGLEYDITPEHLRNLQDWDMLVLRRR